MPIKIEAALETIPDLRTFVVAAEQQAEAQKLAGSRVNVVGVKNVAEACEQVFHDSLVRKLLHLGGGSDRHRLVSGLFRIALKGRGEFVDWAPVERAAIIASDEWLEVPDDESWILKFVAGVAARHQRNSGEIPLPLSRPESWPRTLWLDVLSHLLQQSADSNQPSPTRVLPIALKELPSDLKEASPPELRLAGALSRVHAVTGSPDSALLRQSQLSQILWQTFAWQELSRPLAEWLRLSGACGATLAFAEAENLYREADGHGAFDQFSGSYVRLAWARSVLSLGLDRGMEPIDILFSLSTDERLSDSVRWAAVRWLARVDSGDHRASAARRRLESITRSEGQPAEIAAQLARLDGIGTTGPGDRGDALGRLRVLQPGIVHHLITAGSDDRLDYVPRFFPY